MISEELSKLFKKLPTVTRLEQKALIQQIVGALMLAPAEEQLTVRGALQTALDNKAKKRLS